MKYTMVKVLDEKTPRWSDYCVMYIDQARAHLKPKTVDGNIIPTLRGFAPFAKNKRIGDIESSSIIKWAASLVNFSTNTINHRIAVLQTAFNYAVKHRIISSSPAAWIKKPRMQFKGRLIHDDEIKKILAFLPQEIRRAALFSLYTGTRTGEVLSLDWSWLDGDRIVIPDYLSKSRRSRIIFIAPSARAILGEVGQGKIFTATADRIRWWIRKCWKALGIPRFRFHDFRGTFATRFMEKSGDIYSLMAQCGWAQEQSTRPYQHITDARRKAVCDVSYSI